MKSTSLKGTVEKLFGLLLFAAIARIALTKIIGSYPQFLGKSASSSGISLPIIASFALGFDLDAVVLSPLDHWRSDPSTLMSANYSRANTCFLQVSYPQSSPPGSNWQRPLT